MTTLQDFFDRFYRPLRLRGRSPETARQYHCTITAWAKALGRQPTLDDLADEIALARHVDHRQQTVSPYSAEKERCQLMAMARLANERRMIPALPSCPPCVLPDRIPTAWSEDELRRLFDAAGRVAGRAGEVPMSVFFQTLLLVAFETGERVGALLGIQREHIQRPWLHVPGELRKGGRRSRVYELSPEACDRLEDMAASNQGHPVFFWPGGKTYIWQRLKRIRELAGLAGRRLAFQQVRRSAISHYAAAGGDPVQFAGHAQASTTRRWYLDPRYAARGPRPADLLPRLAPKSSAN